MADFKRVVITRDGQKLMSDIIAEKKTLSFTRLIISEDDVATISDKDKEGSNYADENVNLDYFRIINQETPELQVHTVESLAGMSNPSVEVIASVDNRQLTKGYYMKTLGLCAEDNGGNEILYAYTYADQPGYMPPYNGKTTSGAMFKITVTVGNTDQVNLLQGVGYASSDEVDELRQQLNDVQTIVGYNESDVFGLEADFENNQFTRLAGAKGLKAGKDFDNLGPWKRKRCMIDYKSGDVVVYEGDSNFSENGILDQPIIGVNGKSYSNQVSYAIMVEQPKFYYRVVPVKTTDHGNGRISLDKGRYYVSTTPHIGFKLHPAFIKDGQELDKIYLSAYPAQKENYISSVTPEGQINFVSILSSKLNISTIVNKPVSFEQTLQRMQKLNSTWTLASFKTYSISLMLYIVEHGGFNDWALQNPRGNITEYRGEKDLDETTILFDRKYSVQNNKLTIYDQNGSKEISVFSPMAKGYISRFRYNEEEDWAFYPIMNQGTSTAPVGSIFDYGSFVNMNYLLVGGEPFSIQLIEPSGNLRASARLIFK